jgi:hypothetical protein
MRLLRRGVTMWMAFIDWMIGNKWIAEQADDLLDEVNGPADDALLVTPAHPHCAFCQGALAARNGEPRNANPHRSPEEVASPYELWDVGWLSEREDSFQSQHGED